MIMQPGAQPLDMGVVVGKAYHSQTPVFANYLRYIIFRPYWEVPGSIARAELIPKIRRNPNYMAANNYILANGAGEVVADGAVSDEVLRGLRSGAYRINKSPCQRMPWDWSNLSSRIRTMSICTGPRDAVVLAVAP